MRKEIRIEVAIVRIIAIILLPYLKVALTTIAVVIGSPSRSVITSSSSALSFLVNLHLVLGAWKIAIGSYD